MELDLLGGVGQVGLEQGIGQQPGYALKDELEVLGGGSPDIRATASSQKPSWLPHSLTQMPPHSPRV